jgi:hypothetical protein
VSAGGAGINPTPASDATQAQTVRTIAREAGASPPAGMVDSPYSTLLVVPDDLVETVLADVEQLPRRDGEPLETGRYADFDSADDLEPGEVLALWYSGHSLGCPTYLQGLRVTAGGDLDAKVSKTTENACAESYNLPSVGRRPRGRHPETSPSSR